MSDLYGALGVSSNATGEEINRAYRKTAKAAHPDTGGSRERFDLVRLAKDVLTDADRRAHYDRTGEYGDVGPDLSAMRSMQIALQALVEVIAICVRKGRTPDEYDLINDSIRKVREKQQALEETKTNSKAEAKEFRRLAKKFKPKDGKPNRISPMFDGQAAECERQIAATKELLDAHKAAIDLLKEHSF